MRVKASLKFIPLRTGKKLEHYIVQSQLSVCAYENIPVLSRRQRVMGGTDLWNRALNVA
jgi:hypothetical protein